MSAILPTLYLISHPRRNHPYSGSHHYRAFLSLSLSLFLSFHTRSTPSRAPFPLGSFLRRAFASKALDYLPLISARVAHLLPRLLLDYYQRWYDHIFAISPSYNVSSEKSSFLPLNLLYLFDVCMRLFSTLLYLHWYVTYLQLV